MECLVIFDWMPDIINFYLLGARYFWIPRNILELYYLTQLSYLETNWFFQNLAFTLLRKVSLGLILLHCCGKILLDTLPKPLWILWYSKLVGRGTSPGLLWTLMIVSSNFCGWHFPQLRVISLLNPLIVTHLNTCLGPLAGIWMLSQCAVSICPLLFPVNSSDLGLSGLPASPLRPRNTAWFHLSSLLYARDLKLSLHSNLGLHRTL